VSDGGCGSLRYAQNGVTTQMQSINNRLQITLERCEGNVGDVAIGKPKTSTIITDEPDAVGEETAKRSADGTLPVVLEVGGPGGNTHERHTLAHTCNGNVDAVFGPAKRELLTTRTNCWRSLVRFLVG